MIDKNTLKKIKLIALDLDGTLLNTKGEIGEESKKLIHKLQSMDVRFTFASGRLHSALITYADALKIQTPLISLDGSLIKNYPDGDIIFESFVKEKYVRKCIYYADKLLLNVALCHDDAIFYTENNSVIPQIMDKYGARYEEVPAYDDFTLRTLEVVFASDYKDNIRYVKDRMQFPYAFGLNTSYFKSHSHGGIYYLEVRKSGSSKGKGLLRLMKYLKLKSPEVAVLGDWHNDISLFEIPVLKIAPANAVPEIKRLADLITRRDNNTDAVAEFLELVLKAKM